MLGLMLTCYRVQMAEKWQLLARLQGNVVQPCYTHFLRPAFFLLPSTEMEEEREHPLPAVCEAGLFSSHHVDRKVITQENNLSTVAW